MSTTALVRSPSSTITRTVSSNNAVAPSPSQQLSRASPTSTTVLPNIRPASTPPPSQPKPSSSTPATQTPTQQPSPSLSTPGRWQHPRMEEILRRQNRSNFDNTNMRTILWNVLFLVLSFVLPSTVKGWLPIALLQSTAPYTTYTLYLIQILSIGNISIASLPLLRQPDPCTDIPLTPSQRQLFGLPPLSRPATPQEREQWITPPRYSRSASNTPRSSSSSLRAEVSGSPVPPLSSATIGAHGYGSGSAGRRGSGSPLTPGGRDGGRRLSLNRNSPLSISEFDAAGSVNTPSKVNTRASVGLNSKWLYEKGRASPTGMGRRESGGGGGWGTGSVFT